MRLANRKKLVDGPRGSATGATNEVELLLCCARVHMDSRIAERGKALIRGGVDWSEVERTAIYHGVTHLLYRNVRAVCPEAVPQDVLVRLQSYFHAKALHNDFLAKELLEILDLFDGRGIRALAFKGPLLAVSVYGDLSLREYGDLDILVHKRDFLKSERLLLSNGYRVDLGLSWKSHLSRTQRKVSVDLHGQVAPNYFPEPFGFDRMWERLQPLPFADRVVLNLRPEDLLLLLCVQWAKDCCERSARLAQLCDIAELIRLYPGLNWGMVLGAARARGIERILWLYLLMADELLGVSLPERVASKMRRDSVAEKLAAQTRGWIFLFAEGRFEGVRETLRVFWLPPNLRIYPYRFHLSMRERARDKIAYCLNRLGAILLVALGPNENDRKVLPLPSFLHPLHYLLRPFRLALKYGLGLLKPIRRLFAKDSLS